MKWFMIFLLLTACTAQLNMKTLIITSNSFEKEIPSKYTCDGENINPSLNIEGIPNEAKSLAIIMEDPDAVGGLWIHWLVWNVPPGSVAEDSVPGIQGLNSANKNSYGGPCPPSGIHRYVFKVYALDTELDLAKNAIKSDVERAMKGHIVAEGELTGLYSKK